MNKKIYNQIGKSLQEAMIKIIKTYGLENIKDYCANYSFAPVSLGWKKVNDVNYQRFDFNGLTLAGVYYQDTYCVFFNCEESEKDTFTGFSSLEEAQKFVDDKLRDLGYFLY